jgi:hypothetical protein
VAWSPPATSRRRGRPPATPSPRAAHAATALCALTRAATVTEKHLCFASSRPARRLGSPPSRRYRQERFHADRHLWPWNRLADATASTAWAPRTSPSHELGATATGRRSPCRSPPAAAHHRGGPHPGEFLGPKCTPNRIPALPTRSSTLFPLPSPPATAGIDRSRRRRAMGSKLPCFGRGLPARAGRASRPIWLAHVNWAKPKPSAEWPMCTVHPHNFHLDYFE